MWLLIIILHKEEWLDDVLSCLVEVGIDSAVVQDSKTMKSVLADEVPIFALFKASRDTPISKIIFALTDIPNVDKEIAEIMKAVGLDFAAKGVGNIITMKVDSVQGPIDED